MQGFGYYIFLTIYPIKLLSYIKESNIYLPYYKYIMYLYYIYTFDTNTVLYNFITGCLKTYPWRPWNSPYIIHMNNAYLSATINIFSKSRQFGVCLAT